MGFGFNLGFIFIILPLTTLLFITWVITWRKIFFKLFLLIWAVVIGLVCLGSLADLMPRPSDKKILSKQDYYGHYVIDRSFFKGPQADWQYDHFRFEITTLDSIYFYVTKNDEVVKTFHGTVRTIAPHRSARLVIDMAAPRHHVVASNPTTYRSRQDFYLVFHSNKYGNMFFRKGHWEKIAN